MTQSTQHRSYAWFGPLSVVLALTTATCRPARADQGVWTMPYQGAWNGSLGRVTAFQVSRGAPNGIAVWGQDTSANPGGTGVYGSSNFGTGISGYSNEGNGVLGWAGSLGYAGVMGRSNENIGVRGASNASYGCYGSTLSPTYAATIGINNGGGPGLYGQGSVGVSGSGTVYAGQFNGVVIASSYTTSSDARYKTNIATLPDALGRILALRGVSFDWRRNEFPQQNFRNGRQIGFIAQEVEKVLPELVHKNRDGYRSVDYTAVLPVLVEAVKQQQHEIDTMKTQVASVNSKLAQIGSAPTKQADAGALATSLPWLTGSALPGLGVGCLRRRSV